jgi:iron complex transport system ATP-binding protein
MALVATNLSFSYPKGPTVLSSINASIEPGAITAILGPNGAGKSTLARLLAGVQQPDSGSVTIQGRTVQELSTQERASKLAYIAQRSSLAFDFDVRLVVSFGRLSLPKDSAAVENAMDQFGLSALADKPMGTLSVGQQQRVSIARAFAQLDGTSDSYLIADEPTSAMDPRHQLESLSALQELAKTGVGIALVAHDLTLASRFADRVILLDQHGRVHAQGDSAAVLNPKTLEVVYQTPFMQSQIGGHNVLFPATPHAASDTIQHA